MTFVVSIKNSNYLSILLFKKLFIIREMFSLFSRPGKKKLREIYLDKLCTNCKTVPFLPETFGDCLEWLMYSAHEDNSYGTTTRSRSNIDLSSFLCISLIAPVQLKHLTQPPHCVVYCLFLECSHIILLMCVVWSGNTLMPVAIVAPCYLFRPKHRSHDSLLELPR